MTEQRFKRHAWALWCLYWAGCLALLALASCTTAPQTFNERLAYAVVTQTAAVEAVAAGVRSGELEADEAERMLDAAQSARDLMDASRRVHEQVGETPEASRQLALALAILTELQTVVED